MEHGFSSIPGCPFGRLATDASLSSQACVDALHAHGMVLFKGNVDLQEKDLVGWLRQRFPEAAPRPPAAGQKRADSEASTLSAVELDEQAADVLAYLDRRLVSSMGSVKNEEGGFAIDYVPASTHGAAFEAPSDHPSWDEELDRSLGEWCAERQECAFQEWHTDGMFGPSPPSCTVLHCVKPGNSFTAFADGQAGFARLPPSLRQLAEHASVVYRPSIIYGNPALSIPSLGSRVDQNRASGRQVQAAPGPLPVNTLLPGVAPLAGDPTYAHPLVQTHPWTGAPCLRFSIKALETVGGLVRTKSGEADQRTRATDRTHRGTSAAIPRNASRT